MQVCFLDNDSIYRKEVVPNFFKLMHAQAIVNFCSNFYVPMQGP